MANSWIDQLNSSADVGQTTPFAQLQAARQPAPAPRPQPKSSGGLLGKVGRFGVGVAKGVAQPFEDFAKAAGTAFSGNSAIDQNEAATQHISDNVQQASQLYKSGKISGTQYRQMLNSANQTLGGIRKQDVNIQQATSPKKIISSGAQIGAYAAAPGLNAVKGLLPTIGANAGLGSLIGGASAVENNASGKQTLQQALLGGAVGGATGALSNVLGRTLSRGKPAAVKPVASTPGTYDASQINNPQVKQMIERLNAQRASAAPEAAPPSPTQPTVMVGNKPAEQITVPGAQDQSTAGRLANNASSLISPPGSSAPNTNVPSALPISTSPSVEQINAQLTAKTPELSSSLNNLLQESQNRINSTLAEHGETTAVAKELGLPEGYKADINGSVFAPSGKRLTMGEVQQLHYATKGQTYVADYENAANRGDRTTMSKIAAQHPGDERLHTMDETSAAAPVPKRSNILQRAGRGLQKPAIGAVAPPSPFGSAKESDIVNFLKGEGMVKAGDNAQSIYDKLPAKFADYQKQMHQALSSSGASLNVNADDLAHKIAATITGNNHFLGTDSASQNVANNLSAAVKNAARSDGNLGAGELYSLKQQIQGELSRAFDKAAKGAPLTGGEDALLTGRNVLNDLMPNEARAIGRKESMLYDAADGLNKARNVKARIPRLAGLVVPHMPSKALAHGIESLGTATGVPLEAAGNVAAKASDVASKAIAPLATNPVVQAEAPLAAAAGATNMPAAPQTAQPEPQPPASNDITNLASPAQAQSQGEPTSSQQQDLGLTPDDIQKAMIMDLMTTGGANLSKLSTINTLLEARQKAAQPQSMSQTAVNQIDTVQRAQNGLSAIAEAFKSTQGTGEGLLSKVLAGPVGRVSGLGNNVANVNRTIQVALPEIAKALGMGTSSAELKAVAAQLPNTSDTQQSAHAKLGVIAAQINQYMSQYLHNQSNYVQPTNNTLDALAQMSSGGLLNQGGATA